VRILPGNKLALIDFGLRGRPLAPYLVAPQIQLWKNDLDNYAGILDPISIMRAFLDFHQHGLYKAIDSMCYYIQSDINDVIGEIVELLKFDPASATQELKDSWKRTGSGTKVIRESIKNFKDLGLNINVHSLGAQRSHHTYIHMIQSVGMKEAIWPEILKETITRIESERPDLLIPDRKMVMDQALEYLYAWCEKLEQSNSELSHKIQRVFRKSIVAELPDEQLAS
jgi:hypothetical protein